MGNTLKSTVEYLKDPHLVRKFQELCGVQQILLTDLIPVPECETDTEVADTDPTSKDKATTVQDSVSKCGHSRDSSSEVETTDIRKSSSRKAIHNGSDTRSSLEWLKRKAKVRHRIKTPSPSHSRTSSLDSEIDVCISKYIPVEVTVESYPLLDVYFRLATECGYETFYITFIPFIFWNIDSLVARHGIILWCMSMYVGQACKQLIKWRRPASPPALRLEHNPNLETEYGFPSTHAIVAIVLPVFFLYSTYGRYEYPLWIGIIIALNWSFSVCFSRVYLGVHSIMDIIGGITISIVILLLTVPTVRTLDDFVLESKYGLGVIFIIVIFLIYIYPVDPNNWSMDRGDTAAILGGTYGLITGFAFHGPYPEDLGVGPYEIVIPSLHIVSLSIVRFVVGVLLILPTRFIMKLLCFKLLPILMPTHGVKEVVQRPLVELPYKVIAYGSIGFIATYLAPHVFKICGISRS